LWLDIAVTLLLGGLGWFGMKCYSLAGKLLLSFAAIWQGFANFLTIMAWTFFVQRGYAIITGKPMKPLARSLAKEYAGTAMTKALAAGLTAALGEELLYRGLIQQKWNLIAREKTA